MLPSSAASANRRLSQPKHKAACDQCTASKVKCSGGVPRCKRCADGSHPCRYSLARRYGKPPGSRNRKTLERLHQAQERHLEDHGGGWVGCSIPQNNGSREDGGGLVDDEREGEESLNRFQTLSTTHLWPTLSLIDYPAMPDTSQVISSPGQDFLDGHRDVPTDGGDGLLLHSADPGPTDIEGLGRAESRRMWANDPDEDWDASSPSIDQQLSSGPIETDSPLSEYPHSSTSETHMLISLDTVAARLEEAAPPMVSHFQRQPTLCLCLRKYADVLCKLQTIEKRQRPVHVDTFLTCTTLVLNIAENQVECIKCLDDSCIAMQLIMIFQTIFTWSQNQCHSPDTPAPDLRATLGHHEMTVEEYTFVKTALVYKAICRIITLLKHILSRVDNVPLHRQEKSSRDPEGADLWNIQPLVSSLVQGFVGLRKRLPLEQLNLRHALED